MSHRNNSQSWSQASRRDRATCTSMPNGMNSWHITSHAHGDVPACFLQSSALLATPIAVDAKEAPE